VRTYYMPNAEWRAICEQGRALREAAGTLTGHAAGDHAARAIDPTVVFAAIGGGRDTDDMVESRDAVELPEPLAAVIDYLGDDVDRREFVPTAELVEALAVEPTAFGRQMGELGCEPTRRRAIRPDGTARQVRGYLTADLRAAIDEWERASPSDRDQGG